MLALGGKVIGVRREKFAADTITKEIDAVTADVEQWKGDHAAIKARTMERDLAERIDEARAGLRHTAEVARLRQDRAQDEMNANLMALEKQAALATPDTRSHIEHRLGEIRTDLGERAEKLARAYELTREAPSRLGRRKNRPRRASDAPSHPVCARMFETKRATAAHYRDHIRRIRIGWASWLT